MQPEAPDPWTLLVSPRVGLVTELAPQARGAEEPAPPYLYTATMAHFDFRAAERQDRLCAGKGRTERAAKLSALGEAVERYSAYHLEPHRVRLAKWAQVEDAALSPAELVLYSEDQYRRPGFQYTRWNAEAQTSWIDGVELPSGRPIALPASLVYLSAPARTEDFFTPATSNGLAAGPNLEAAILGGLHELIERDALLLCWMNRLPATEILLPAGGSIAAGVRAHYARFGVELRLLLIPTDLPASVVMALAVDGNPEHPARLIGMGCDLDPANAMEKAVFELCQARPSEIRRFRQSPPAGRLRSYEDVKQLEDHPAFLCLPENAHEYDFLWSTGARRPLAELDNRSTGTAAGDLEACVAGLAETGARIAYVDLTMPDVRSAGYVVVRTLASGLQPIHFGHGEERLGGDRLYEAALRLGHADRRRTAEELNFCPHPLA
jgi:ribosomal protein S12 methylthiotransferase accessory factor